MADRVRRRRFQKVVIWEPASGSIINLPSRYVLSNGGPSKTEEYAKLASGSKTPIRRNNQVQIPITHRELGLFGEIIHRTSCPVEAAFISRRDMDNWMWLEPTRLQVRDPEIDPGRQSQKVIELESDVFYPAIWESTDLIGGIPWQGTKGQTASQIEGDPVRLEPAGNLREGYTGPGWEVQDTSDNVGLAGNANLSQGATLTFNFPVWGAKLRLEPLEKFSLGDITLVARDFNGNALQTVTTTQNAEITLPDRTWSLEISISDSTSRPKLIVKQLGKRDAVIYAGGVTPDCSKVDDPDYTEFPTPNTPPEWIQKESLLWEKSNTAPTFTTLCDFTVSGSLTGEGNTAPTFTSLDNYEVVETETGFAYTAPTIQPTAFLYTANGGFSEIEWGTWAYSNFADSKGDGELAADGNKQYIFVARSDGVYRYDLNGGNETRIAGDDPFGVAVDRTTSTLYYTEEGETGVYKVDYDGSNKSKVFNARGKGASIAVAPDGGDGGYIFTAYADELVRRDLDGSFEKVLDTSSVGTDTSTDIRTNVHLHLSTSQVFYGKQTVDTSGSTSYTDAIVKIGFDGSGKSTIFSRSGGSPYSNPNNWTIVQDEDKFVRVETREGNSDGDVITRDLDGGNKTTEATLTTPDTGKYVTSLRNTDPNFTTLNDFTVDDNLT